MISFLNHVTRVILLLLLSGCQGQLNFKWGSQNPRTIIGTQLIAGFEKEIYPVLYSSCRDCHQVGKLKGDAPFADGDKAMAFSAALTRFQLIEEKIKGNHQYNNWGNDLKSDKQSFQTILDDYVLEICAESPKISYCKAAPDLKTSPATFSGPISSNFQYVRFNITNLVYPSGLPTGKFPVFAEIGLRDVSGLLAFGDVRVFSPSDDLTLGDISVEHNSAAGALILRKFPQVNIGVVKANTTVPPANTLPGNSLTTLLSAPIASSSIQATAPIQVALKFGSIQFGLPNTAPLTPQQRFDQGVVPILQKSCMGCHRNTLGNNFQMFPADSVARYTNSKNRITPKNFAGSLLVQKGTGSVAHGGGNAFNFGVNATDRAIVEAWINSEP